MDEEGSRARPVPLAQQILRYLVRHPAAKDTAEGVLTWWVRDERVGCDKAAVQAALDCLVVKGWLRERETKPSGRLYGLRRGCLREIRAFLATGESSSTRDDA